MNDGEPDLSQKLGGEFRLNALRKLSKTDIGVRRVRLDHQQRRQQERLLRGGLCPVHTRAVTAIIRQIPMNAPAARVVRPISFKGDVGFKRAPVGVAGIVVPVETCGL
ncbi:MAG: hypothetical protein NTZ14_16380 [Hyphomicrobiales bacterium]|nr:hypothetical protein [Hyphomicrobiales bacterium]